MQPDDTTQDLEIALSSFRTMGLQLMEEARTGSPDAVYCYGAQIYEDATKLIVSLFPRARKVGLIEDAVEAFEDYITRITFGPSVGITPDQFDKLDAVKKRRESSE